MEDILIAAAVLGALYLFCKRTDAPLIPTQTPAPPPPMLPAIGGPIIIGDSYGIPPFTVNNAPGVTPTSLPSTVAAPTALPPPPPVLGGIAGGAGTGGLPLGGPISPGVSTGTGTSAVVGLSGAPVDIFGRGIVVGGQPPAGYDIWGRPLGN